jgi:microcystin-dependent protein
MAITPQGVPSEPGLTYVNIARSLPFQYTFRGDDFTEFSPATRDLFENRDRELELKLTDLGGSTPIGGVIMFGGLLAGIPVNYFPCDGRSLDTTEFSDLFRVIGYRYGGSGANFTLPLPVGYVPYGVGTDAQSVFLNISTNSKPIGAHSHNVNTNTQSSGHTHNFNQTGDTSSSGHTHTLGASTGDGGVDHFHGGNTGNANANHAHSGNTGTNSVGHTHVYFKGNSGANNNTGGVSVNHTHGFNTSSDGAAHSHDVVTGLATAFNHAHNAAANVNATTADTAHLHNASTIANSTADTAHTHTLTAVTGNTSHLHDISAVGFYFIIRYQ